MTNFQFSYNGELFKFDIHSHPGVGSLHEAELKLIVQLMDYVDIVSELVIPFTIQWREEILIDAAEELIANTTESGFELYTLPEVITLEPIHHHGFVSQAYTLPAIKNVLEVVSPMYLNPLPYPINEFALYDKQARTIFIEGSWLKEEHEGIYNLIV